MANPFYVQPANVGSALQALMQGHDLGQKQQQQRAMTEAGQLYAAGDVAGAQAAAARGGSLQALMGFAQLQNSDRDHSRALSNDERSQKNTEAQLALQRLQIAATQGNAAASHALAKAQFEFNKDQALRPEIKSTDDGLISVDRRNNTATILPVAGRPSENLPAGLQPPPGVNRKAWLEARSKQLGNIDDKAVMEADKAVQTGTSALTALDRALNLSKNAYSGPLAQQRGYYASQFGSQRGVDTELLTNTVTSTALENLRAAFGGNPTEGERKILLDVQGAANQAPEVREQIYKDAREAAVRRIDFNRRLAEDMRSGQYLLPQAARQPQTPNSVAAPQATAGEPVRITSPQQRDALAPGTPYVAPDGTLRTKQ